MTIQIHIYDSGPAAPVATQPVAAVAPIAAMAAAPTFGGGEPGAHVDNRANAADGGGPAADLVAQVEAALGARAAIATAAADSDQDGGGAPA